MLCSECMVTAEQRKHYLNLSYAIARKTPAVKGLVIKTTPEEGTLQPTEFKIRSTGRQMFGSTKDFPFHDIDKFSAFKG